MFRPGRNPKDQTHADDTADHTPQTPATGAAGYTPNSTASAGAAQTPTEAYQQSVHTPTAGRAVTESESLARDIKEGTLTGFVGNGTSLTGGASFRGMLRVDGHLSGRISSQDGTLIVSTNGQVDANVEVAVAQIYGTINGDVTATKRIEMGRVAKVTGNIQTPALVIENGAIFEGSCRMTQAQEQAATATDASAASSSSSSAGASSGAGASKSGSSGTSGTSGSSRSSYSSSSPSSSSPATPTASDTTDATDAAAS